MESEELDSRLSDFARTFLKPTQPGVIEMKYDGGLIVTPSKAVVDGKDQLTFKSINAKVLVSLPEGIVVPIQTVEAAIPEVPGPPKFIELDAGQELTFKAINTNIYLEYMVTTSVFEGFTEGVSRPPVIIIKKVDI